MSAFKASLHGVVDPQRFSAKAKLGQPIPKLARRHRFSTVPRLPRGAFILDQLFKKIGNGNTFAAICIEYVSNVGEQLFRRRFIVRFLSR
jgi:hypothetical protein